MERWVPVAVGVVVVAAIGVFVFRSRAPSGPKPAASEASALARADAGRADGGYLDDSVSALLSETSPYAASDAGWMLPPGSPKTVRFGVVLIVYRGAEGAPATARPKDEALRLARSLAEGARTDFRGAVAKGDPGSMDDAGRMPRGVLEPPVEYALFTLKPGQIADPVDTPRGYFVLRRID
jgi:hypothetical protein